VASSSPQDQIAAGEHMIASGAERWGIEEGTTRVWFAMPSEAARPAESQ
jgi:hypothetical protein